jgi:hypothetical protein
MCRFVWKCSYMGTVWYQVTDATGTYKAALRHSVGEYELSIANGDIVRRDMKAGIGLLVRDCNGATAVPAETVAAFNAWRMAEHTEQMARLDSQPERYGVIAPDDEMRRPPMTARAAVYVIGPGWTPVCETESGQ